MLSHALRAASSKPTFTYNGTASSATDAASYTFTAVSIGTAATNRRVIIVLNTAASALRSISSATIGGISATIYDASLFANSIKIIYATVPTGTTADVVVNFSGTLLRIALGSYSVYNLKSITPIAVAQSNSWSSGAISATVSAPADSILLAGVYTSTTANSFTWTNATLNYTTSVETGTNQSGASVQTTTGGNTTITATATGATAGRLTIYAWR
jgi:hypothetical protein